EPLEQVEVMRTLVQQHAATFTRPGRAPAAARIVEFRAEPVRNGPTDSSNFAKLAALQQRSNLLVEGIRALVEHRGKHDAACLRIRCDKTLTVGLVHGDRFFNECVKS